MTKTLHGIVDSMFSLVNNEENNKMYWSYQEVTDLIAQLEIYKLVVKQTPFYKVTYYIKHQTYAPNAVPFEMVLQADNKEHAKVLFRDRDNHNQAVIHTVTPYNFSDDEIYFVMTYYKKGDTTLSYPQPFSIKAKNIDEARAKFYDIKGNENSIISNIQPQP